VQVCHLEFIILSYSGPFASVPITTTKTLWWWHGVVRRNMVQNW